jgi:hypothetical protein
VSLTLRLSPAEVVDLKFNDKIWIKDTWYFVQQIYDYVVGDHNLLKVDLVKVPLPAIPGPIPVSATGGTGGRTCRTVSLCNNNPLTDPPTTYTYVDCGNILRSVTLGPQACGQEVCVLWPLVNTLPTGWSAVDLGSCGTVGGNLSINIVTANAPTPSPYTTVTLYGATSGPTGTYVAMNNYTVDGNNNFTVTWPNLPSGYGIKLGLSSTLTPGATCTSELITLAVNGATGVTASRSGTYQPIGATFTAAINTSNTYTAYVNITY